MGFVTGDAHDDGIGNASGLELAGEVMPEIVRVKVRDSSRPA